MKKVQMQAPKAKKYDDPELYQFVVDERGKNKSWEEITSTLVDSEWGKIGMETVKKIYHRAMAKSVMVERKGGEKFDEFGNELKRLFKRAIATLDSQLKKVERVDELIDVAEIEDQAVLIKYLKLAPTMNSTIQQIFSAIKVYQEQQDKIREEIKGAVWDDGKLLDRMDTMLLNMKKEGWVIIAPSTK